jgi:hypothetical protein
MVKERVWKYGKQRRLCDHWYFNKGFVKNSGKDLRNRIIAHIFATEQLHINLQQANS